MIELWINECYSCDRKGKYDAIRQYVLDNQIPLDQFIVKRVILKKEWTEAYQKSGLELPILVFKDEKGTTMVNYQEWLLQQIKMQTEEPKEQAEEKTEEVKPKRTRKRTASIKQKEVKTTEVE